MPLWGGRFTQGLNPAAWELNASLSFDRRLAAQDVRGSLAWARAIQQAGILTAEECQQICTGLEVIGQEFANGTFVFQENDEDIHTAVERRLGETIGPLAGKLQTGRSRNDQVATDLRLWLLENLPLLDSALQDMQVALIERAEIDYPQAFSGYTHTQRAQPILLSHWWLSHFWPLQRDRQRISQLTTRTSVLPLGCGALAGTAFPIDRPALAASLGFISPAPNSLDAVADRDFVAEFLFCAALIGVHLSKLAEAVVLFTTTEFGFFELSDAFSTGSSLMPQKKNPDVFELARGKAGTLIGALTGLLATLKGLPSTYDKDLQEDKVPLFNAWDTLMALLPVLAGALRTLSIHPERLVNSLDTNLLATDLADYLVRKGVPFRQAHHAVGQVVQLAHQSGRSLEILNLNEYQAAHPAFTSDVYTVFDVQQSLSNHTAVGGTAPQAVLEQIQMARLLLCEDR